LLLSPGNSHDVVMAPALVDAAGFIARLIADKAYDTNPFRALLAGKAIEPVIPRSAVASRSSLTIRPLTASAT